MDARGEAGEAPSPRSEDGWLLTPHLFGTCSPSGFMGRSGLPALQPAPITLGRDPEWRQT